MIQTLHKWIIIELTDYIVVGQTDEGREIYTDSILHILNNTYLVTNKHIYVLGNPERKWISTNECKQKLERFGYILCS